MNNFNKAISYIIVYTVLSLLCIKLVFSYLDVEIGWWIRHLTPNYIKYNFFNLPRKFSEYIEYAIIPLLIVYILLNFKKLGNLIFPILISLVLFSNIILFKSDFQKYLICVLLLIAPPFVFEIWLDALNAQTYLAIITFIILFIEYEKKIQLYLNPVILVIAGYQEFTHAYLLLYS